MIEHRDSAQNLNSCILNFRSNMIEHLTIIWISFRIFTKYFKHAKPNIFLILARLLQHTICHMMLTSDKRADLSS